MKNLDLMNILFNLVIASTAVLGFLMLVLYFLSKQTEESNNNASVALSKFFDSFIKALCDISAALTPNINSKIGSWYTKLLMFTELTVKEFFYIKNAMFVIVTIFMILVGFTDSKVMKKEIYNNFEYIANPVFNFDAYTDDQKRVIQKKKIVIFDYFKDEVGINNILAMDEDAAITRISDYLKNHNDTGIDDMILADDIYKRLVAYDSIVLVTPQQLFLVPFAMYFLPEIIIMFINFFNQANSRAEKRFLKRLMIMNGSIKPVDFMTVLRELIDKSKYFKKTLQEIEDYNKKNYEENTRIYLKYIQQAKDVETKLFFEKLDEANNYDFDQAILNIKNEFNLDKRVQNRKCKKAVENIHIWGLVGFMALIVMMIMYLLLPWLTIYDMNSLM